MRTNHTKHFVCLQINMSSCLGIGAVARMTDYCASKFGVYGFSEALRLEMKQR